jgi:hypothetical protein
MYQHVFALLGGQVGHLDHGLGYQAVHGDIKSDSILFRIEKRIYSTPTVTTTPGL